MGSLNMKAEASIFQKGKCKTCPLHQLFHWQEICPFADNSLRLATEGMGVSQLPQFPWEDLCVQSLQWHSMSLQALKTKAFLLVHIHHCLTHSFGQCSYLSKQPGDEVRDGIWSSKDDGMLLPNVQRYSLSACPAEVKDETHTALHECHLSHPELSLGQWGFSLCNVMTTSLVGGLSSALLCLTSVLTTVSSKMGGPSCHMHITSMSVG